MTSKTNFIPDTCTEICVVISEKVQLVKRINKINRVNKIYKIIKVVTNLSLMTVKSSLGHIQHFFLD
jgi:hypothetical protein